MLRLSTTSPHLGGAVCLAAGRPGEREKRESGTQGMETTDPLSRMADPLSTSPSPPSPALPRPRPSTPTSTRRSPPPILAGNNSPTDAWLDLAAFVAGGGGDAGRAGIFDDLAARIGKDVYLDVAGWHLYLRDIKVDGRTTLASALAAKLGSAVADGGFKQAGVEAALTALPVRLGGGKAQVSLLDAVPAGALGDLYRALEDFERGK